MPGRRGRASRPAHLPLRTLRCMQGMLTGGLLAAAFIAVAGAALVVVPRLFRISRPGRGEARTDG